MEGSGIHENNKATFSETSKRQLSFMEQCIKHDGYRFKRSLLWQSEVKIANKIQ